MMNAVSSQYHNPCMLLSPPSRSAKSAASGILRFVGVVSNLGGSGSAAEVDSRASCCHTGWYDDLPRVLRHVARDALLSIVDITNDVDGVEDGVQVEGAPIQEVVECARASGGVGVRADALRVSVGDVDCCTQLGCVLPQLVTRATEWVGLSVDFLSASRCP